MNKWKIRITAVTLGCMVLTPAVWAEEAKNAQRGAASPHPEASPGTAPLSGAPAIDAGRAHNAVKSSGDEGGTAAGMPGKGPESGR